MRPFAIVRSLLAALLVASIASALVALAMRGRMTSRGDRDDDAIELVAIFDGHETISRARAFRSAIVTAWYGGGSLDLRDATLAPEGARVTARAIVGGYRLVVPATWRVDAHGKAVFGGFSDARDQGLVDVDGPLLTVDGFALFGGVGIVSEAPDLRRPEASAPAALVDPALSD